MFEDIKAPKSPPCRLLKTLVDVPGSFKEHSWTPTHWDRAMSFKCSPPIRVRCILAPPCTRASLEVQRIRTELQGSPPNPSSKRSDSGNTRATAATTQEEPRSDSENTGSTSAMTMHAASNTTTTVTASNTTTMQPSNVTNHQAQHTVSILDQDASD